MPNWFTAVPGTVLSKEQQKPLVERFKQTFVAPDQRHLPFWFSFPMNPTQRELLLSPRLSDLPQLYLMLGRGIELHVVTGSQVREFFTKQDPNDNVDIYVFDDSFGWCVCSTDRSTPDAREDAPDFLIVAVGDVPWR